ncbi:receptor-interacting serine/threonine-protein kinase 2-like [Corticium candelabrum]|uniref:receptor-interacting serine/threonine-protein kinase 2-like n=1 Tax=Corticium candelabrum TaxID=121492 RepID=UPI002E260EC9|nr:receptor-interacting serine/threonine-protein kinase 2-like [Corticium candelabrum]
MAVSGCRWLLYTAHCGSPLLAVLADVAAFIREASILQRLTDCPYIIRFLGMCIEPGYYAIVMKYVENGNLEDMLLCGVDDHPIIKQWDCRIRMALDIAKGMNYLHSLPSPIIHRDLKTANVLVCRNYDCKIIDFGLAKLRQISSKQSTTSYKGTVAFTAPEIFDGKLEMGKEIKVDVYSYSMILWQLKEMKPIYDFTLSPLVIRVNVMAGQKPRLSDNDYLEGYKEIIERCWDRQPDCRLRFKEIVVMLNGIRSQVSFENLTTTPIGQSPRQQVRRDDEQLVQQLRQQIEQLTQDGSAKDKIIEQLRETPRQHVQVGKGDEQLLVQELIHKIEQLTEDGSAKDEENKLLRQQNSSLEELRRDDQLQRERAFTKERREKEELLQRLQQDKDNRAKIFINY